MVINKNENREAAQEYFNTIDGVRVDFATSYDEGLRKLSTLLYNGTILDLELPETPM